MNDSRSKSVDLYQAQLDGCPQYAQLKAGEMLGLEDFSMLMSVTVAGLRRALLHVARAVEDPDVFGAAVVEAALESLQRRVVDSSASPRLPRGPDINRLEGS